jgi:hypothetical protein
VYCWWGYEVEVSLHGVGGLVPHSLLVVLFLVWLGLLGRHQSPSIIAEATDLG